MKTLRHKHACKYPEFFELEIGLGQKTFTTECGKRVKASAIDGSDIECGECLDHINKLAHFEDWNRRVFAVAESSGRNVIDVMRETPFVPLDSDVIHA